MMKHQHQGFTLIELMIVVAIAFVLSAIAYPSYTEYVRRGHRADARAGLLQAQQWLERAATAQGIYPTTLPNALQWLLPDGTPDPAKRYTISIGNGAGGSSTATAFTLTATPRSAQTGDKCGSYTLTNTGQQGNTSLVGTTTSVDCWRR